MTFYYVLVLFLGLILLWFLYEGVSGWNEFKKAKHSLSNFLLLDGTLKKGSFIESISATNFSIGNFLVPWAFMGFLFGYAGFIISLFTHIFIIVGWLIFAPKLKEYIENKNVGGSIHEFIASKHSKENEEARGLRITASIPTILFLILALSLELFLTANILSPFLGLSVFPIFIILTILICIYAAIGGFKAVIGTDKIQFFLLVLGAIIVGFYTLNPSIDPVAYSQAFGGGVWYSLKSAAGSYLGLAFFGFAWLLVAMDVWQRNRATLNFDTSNQGNVIGMFIVFVMSLVFVWFGIFIKQYVMPSVGSAFIEANNIGMNPVKDIVSYGLQVGQYNIWALGLLTTGIVAAGLSTADTFLIASAHSLVSDDLVGVKKESSLSELNQEEESKLTKTTQYIILSLAIFIIAAAGLLWGLGLFNNPFTLFFLIYSVQFCLFVPLVFSCWFKKDSTAGISSIIFSIMFTLVFGGWLLYLYGKNPSKEILDMTVSNWIYTLPLASSSIGLLVYKGTALLDLSD